tara:strand:+ start:750 stop:1340 length:591 start_codon:yes stop_codon:yes gene_type:complete
MRGSMNKILIIFSLILMVSCDSSSKEKTTKNDVVISDLALNEITIPNTQISISIPVEFTELLIEDIELKWGGNKTAPKWATGNENMGTTISYSINLFDASEVPLKDVMLGMKQGFDRVVPGIIWENYEVITLNGTDWIILEFTSNTIDTEVHNIMVTTDLGNVMPILNFNSTVDQFEGYESLLRNSLESVTLSQGQ